MPSTHLLSLHPVHAQNMLDGLKTIEWRRRWPNVVRPGDRLVIYATTPMSALIGEVTVAAVHRGTPDALWGQHQAAGMVDETLFRTYMGTVPSAVAVEVAHPQRWAQPIGLDDLKVLNEHNFHPPQTTARVDSIRVERYRQWARWNAIGQGRCAWNITRAAHATVSEDDLDWVRDTQLTRSPDPIAVQAWWAGVMADIKTPLSDHFHRADDAPPGPEHTVMVLYVNQPGPLDAHGRPERRRAGFMVNQAPGYPATYDAAGNRQGLRGITAWFVEPWANDLGWTQHLMAVGMHTLETVTPSWNVMKQDLDLAAPLARAMQWPWAPRADGSVVMNDQDVPVQSLRDPQELPGALAPLRSPRPRR